MICRRSMPMQPVLLSSQKLTSVLSERNNKGLAFNAMVAPGNSELEFYKAFSDDLSAVPKSFTPGFPAVGWFAVALGIV